MTTAPVATWDICSQPQSFCVVPTNGGQMSGIQYTKRRKCTFLGLALTELMLGVFLISIGIACIPICATTPGCNDYYNGDYYYYYGIWTNIGTNIWGGALVILFSSFGIAQARQPSNCTIATNLALSIVGAIITCGLTTVEATAAGFSWRSEELVILHSIAASLYFILFILFIVSGSYAGIAHGCCCRGCCCDPYVPQTVSIVQQGQPHMVTMNGQTVIMQGVQQNQPHMFPMNGHTVIMQGNQDQPASGAAYNAPPPMYSQAAPGPSQIPVVEQRAGANNSAFVAELPTKM